MPTNPASSAPDSSSRPRRRYAPRVAPEERREQLLDAALRVIVEQGYAAISIEAIARAVGITRPVVYDHFRNLGRLLHDLVEREERYAVAQLEQIFPDELHDHDAREVLSEGVRHFLDAVANRPATWRLILLPLEGTPEIVRHQVEKQRARMLERIILTVRWAMAAGFPQELDVELTARAIRDLGEEAGRMVLTDPYQYPPERYERFVESVMRLVWPEATPATQS